jgi:imidazole glycerol-phosphate synthase subunit HisH
MNNNKKKIAIIDYQMSNMFSVSNALELLGFETKITSNDSIIMAADGAVLPGVGAFNEAMEQLKKLNLIKTIHNFIGSGKPFMGICLGLQLLFSESEEFGINKGLDIIKGRVEALSKHESIRKVPHIGWNKIIKQKVREVKIDPLKEVKDGSYLYFIHSFYANPADRNIIATTTEYDGFSFCSSILQDNIFACQFHPEKSGPVGSMILNNFFNSN